MTIIVHRKEVDALRNVKKWCLIYGRRKTGKTFLVQEFLQPTHYFFVNRDRSVHFRTRNISLDSLKMLLSEGITGLVVIDEFHRLGDEFLDFLHSIPKKGQLILISSTLSLSKQFFNSKSPLLGFFAEFPVNIIDLDDVVKSLRRQLQVRISSPELLELAILGREPWTIEFLVEKDPKTAFMTVLKRSMLTIPALIGEIFTEEERRLSQVYEGILRAVAVGKHVSTEISNHLHGLRLIEKNDPSTIQPYLHNLCALGILKRIKDHKRRRYYYYHVSSLSELFYYADEKYAVSERRLSDNEWQRIVTEKLPHLVEKEIREALALKFGLEERLVQSNDLEVDGVLTRFNKAVIAIEVKWRESLRSEDVKKAISNLSAIKSDRKLLITKNKPKDASNVPQSIEILDANDLISLLVGNEAIPSSKNHV